MGYTTKFKGKLKLSKGASKEQMAYLKKFNETRRMKRDVNKLMELYEGKYGLPTVTVKPKTNKWTEEQKELFFTSQKNLEELGFNVTVTPKVNFTPADKRTAEEVYGINGEYFVGAAVFLGQDNDASVLDGNSPSSSQPGLWCQWVLNETGTELEWDGCEKFYDYIEWLKYLIDNFFKKWGIKLNGEIQWRGEEFSDMGTITVVNNKVTSKER